jgi:hypothetical protein
MIVGSAAFLDRFVADGFLARTGPLAVTTTSPRTVGEFTVPFEITELRLSPRGRLVALASENDEEEISIHAGPPGGPLATFEADEALFVNDARLLLLERQRSAAVLRLLAFEGSGGREVWSRRLPLWAVRLSFDRASATWHVLGRDEADDVVRVSGRIGEDNVSEERWSGRGLADADIRSVSNGAVLAIETRYTSSRLVNRLFGAWAPLMPSVGRTESRFWSIEDSGPSMFASSRLNMVCLTASGDAEATLCTAFDGLRTRLFAVDPSTRRPEPLASVNGRFYLRGDAGCGWLAGWWDRSLVLVKASTGEAFRLADGEWHSPMLLAKTDTVLGAVFENRRGSVVRLYSMESQN